MVDAVLTAFRRAASAVPAYGRLLHEHGVEPAAVVDRETFTASCPILTKANTFDRFPIDELCAEGTMRDPADVLTSTGHRGRVSVGLSTHPQQAEAGGAIDQALDAAFAVTTTRTLAINCLPMGGSFSSNAMTVATAGVRKDVAIALLKTFGSHFEQVLFVSDPLFMRRLLDYGDEQGVDWQRYRVRVVLSKETFGEHFRSYVASRLGLEIDGADAGSIISSFGVGELGPHLCFETSDTIAVRRAAFRDPALARELFGDCGVLPLVLAYNERRTLIETLDHDQAGYGRMTISMLDPTLPIPLLRYQTGDLVRWLDPSRIMIEVWRRGVRLSGPLPNLLALAGREKEGLPNHSCVGSYQDALYADHRIAARLTGALRVTPLETGFLMVHVQLAPQTEVGPNFADRVRAVLGIQQCAGKVVVSSYEDFLDGMGLDDEGGFAYYVSGEAFALV
jgi:phenylacetate-CoA ligase